MSRAYCLTCNEQVMVTTSGTCPSGHRVAPDHAGPEPWVGNAGGHESAGAALHDVDVADLKELQVAGVKAPGTNGNGNGHAALNGSAPATPTTDAGPAVHRERANSQASDDLAAMLAEALQSQGDEQAEASTPPASTTPTTEPETPPAPRPDDASYAAAPADAEHAAPDPAEDASDLAALAAELQLDTSLPSETESAEAAQAAETIPPPPPPTSSGAAEIWSAPAPAQPEPEPTWPSDVADVADEDLPSPAPVAEPVLDEAPPPSEAQEADATPSVDLTNFTARGTRVGAAGTPVRRLFGRKR